ncbi:Zn-dependent exopeptidase [Wallemia mellicola CBS 633.66]|uniref:Zn-dependent exopeptidase n=1 Tax=Wallemia mellicola (strain ATCC MYA-4683 / CBS 633.66) TaxID=671144 RepID=I4YJA6_WALMC|nr:Zn-dependent exopeptidase [Wallemia mellicola CBS 633.66]EIM24048.1 Zn-dependent exopeptidase [Wallemia mellicola CBS 633.66]|eukprot:XP_006955878.1 Zn-dependent exopeptidase [Wallemia mellicola CBS 633.66]
MLKFVSTLAVAIGVALANKELFSLHKDLIIRPSITRNETLAVDFLIELQDVINPNVDRSIRRQNLFAYLDNPEDVKILLNSHIDVLPPYFEYKEAVDDQGRELIYGRGANDAKGQIAAQIIAVEELRKKNQEIVKKVGFLYDLGEEGLYDGATSAQEILPQNLEYVIAGEPTELFQISSHKGNMGFEIRAKGLAAHSSSPHWGVNAIEKLSEAILKLESVALPQDKILGDTTTAVTKIKGGTAVNKVPDEATAYVNVRTSVPSEETWKALKESGLESEWIDLILVDDSHDPVTLDTIENWRPSQTMPVGTDLFAWKQPTVKKILIGCGSSGSAHKLDEHIYKQELLDGVDMYVELVEGLLTGKLKVAGEHTKHEKDEL